MILGQDAGLDLGAPRGDIAGVENEVDVELLDEALGQVEAERVEVDVLDVEHRDHVVRRRDDRQLVAGRVEGGDPADDVREAAAVGLEPGDAGSTPARDVRSLPEQTGEPGLGELVGVEGDGADSPDDHEDDGDRARHLGRAGPPPPVDEKREQQRAGERAQGGGPRGLERGRAQLVGADVRRAFSSVGELMSARAPSRSTSEMRAWMANGATCVAKLTCPAGGRSSVTPGERVGTTATSAWIGPTWVVVDGASAAPIAAPTTPIRKTPKACIRWARQPGASIQDRTRAARCRRSAAADEWAARTAARSSAIATIVRHGTDAPDGEGAPRRGRPGKVRASGDGEGAPRRGRPGRSGRRAGSA